MTVPDQAVTIPDYQGLMLPVLQAAATGEQRIGALVQQLGETLGLSEAARATLLTSGRQTRLMIRHNVGCRIEETLHLKKLDEDFFE